MDRAGKEGNGQRAQALGSRAVVSNLPNAVTLEYGSPCCGDPPTTRLFSLLLHNCNFATVMNHNVF